MTTIQVIASGGGVKLFQKVQHAWSLEQKINKNRRLN